MMAMSSMSPRSDRQKLRNMDIETSMDSTIPRLRHPSIIDSCVPRFGKPTTIGEGSILRLLGDMTAAENFIEVTINYMVDGLRRFLMQREQEADSVGVRVECDFIRRLIDDLSKNQHLFGASNWTTR